MFDWIFMHNFELLQLALGTRESLSFSLSEERWKAFHAFCAKQALTGIGFAAVERLYVQGTECPKALRMEWMGRTMLIEQRNTLMNDACRSVSAMFARDGFSCCVLKGQGNLLNYPDSIAMRRQPGDIDLWVRKAGTDKTRIKEILQYVNKHSVSRKGAIYHHIDMLLPNEIKVEVHYRIGHFCSPVRNSRLQRWFEQKADECMKNITQGGYAIPTVSVNVIYQMTHIFTHYFDEGVGLRQLMDYYYVLKHRHDTANAPETRQSLGMWTDDLGGAIMSEEEICATFRHLGLMKFAGAVMWVLQYAFAMPDEYNICTANESEGRKLLGEIMEGGNFGQHDSRGRKMKTGGMLSHGLWKLRRIMRLVGSYPEEALCEPLFRVWHLGWRICVSSLSAIKH